MPLVSSAPSAPAVPTATSPAANIGVPTSNADKAAIEEQTGQYSGNSGVIQTTTAQRGQTALKAANLNSLTTNLQNSNGNNQIVTPDGKGNVVPNNSNTNGTNGTGGSNGGTTTIAPDGTITTSSQPVAGTKSTLDPNEASADAATGTYDPTMNLSDQVDNITKLGQSQVDTINSQLKGLMSVTDASTQTQISELMDMYNGRIQAVSQANANMLQTDQTVGYRTGSARYAPGVNQSIMSGEEIAGATRIANLKAELLSKVTDAQNAMKENDSKSLNDASDKIDTLQKSISTEVANLYKGATDYQNAQLKSQQEAATAAKAEITQGITVSKAVAPALAQELAGISDPQQKQDLITAMAKQYGIDSGVLAGEVTSAASQLTKDNLSEENIRSEITKRGTSGNGSGKTYNSGKLTYTDSDLGGFQDALDKGATIGSQTYNGKGTDGYVDPGLYQSLAEQWTKNGGLVKDFVAHFPPNKYVNPKANSGLPSYLRNGTKDSTATSSDAYPGISNAK